MTEALVRDLTVWWDCAQVGTLSIDRHGDLGFAYGQAWLADATAPALSISLPKRSEAFSRRETRPFFAGLLPEEAQRDAVAQALGISKANDFRLLEALGGDVAGALTLWPRDEQPPDQPELDASDLLDDARLVEILDALPTRPFLAGEEGLRLSLAGAQQKLPVVVVEGRIALPLPGQPTTHILKPQMPRFAATTENEAFAMQLARAAGLTVAVAEPRRVRDRPYLLVERYDRTLGADGRLRRLHQEDFCQALGIPPEHKYAAEGGPTFRTSFGLVREHCAVPARDLLQLLDAAIFNVLVGNADAHGKNFSLLYHPEGLRLAPLYDLLCTVAYDGISPRLAMKVARRATLAEFRADTWDAFAEDVGMPKRYVRRRVEALSESVTRQAAAVAEAIAAAGFDRAALDRFATLVQARCIQVLAL